MSTPKKSTDDLSGQDIDDILIEFVKYIDTYKTVTFRQGTKKNQKPKDQIFSQTIKIRQDEK